MTIIPYGRQDVNQQDIDAVVSVLKSEFLTQGPVVPRLEEALANYCQAKYAVAVNSATSALHIACLALGVKSGDVVWTSPITFVASANCARYCGATVDFVDIDMRTYNMCAEKLAVKLAAAKKNGKLPKVVIPVHLTGQSCDMKAIHALSLQYGFKIIEDASHAVGGRYLGQPIGSCQFSDITVLSFHPVKIITTAEGGMALTQNEVLAKKLRRFRSHGITRDSHEMTHAPDGPWYYQQIDLGYNYRLTEIQAALGLSQMSRLNTFVERRHEIAKIYDELLVGLPLALPWQHPDTYNAYHLYVVRVKADNHLKVYKSLQEKGIGVNLHYIPVYKQPYYNAESTTADCPEAEAYYSQAISIPMYSSLPFELQKRVVKALQETLA